MPEGPRILLQIIHDLPPDASLLPTGEPPGPGMTTSVMTNSAWLIVPGISLPSPNACSRSGKVASGGPQWPSGSVSAGLSW